jgi:SAM-dependent methyltransferase
MLASSTPNAPRDVKVTALLAVFNEADIISQVVGDLVDQGVSVYVLNNGSTDETVDALAPYLGRGLLNIERFEPEVGVYAWEEILRRKEALASELEAEWFIHHDGDEFRESPWPGTGLREAIERVDRLGFNAIDFELLNFRPTDDRFRPGADVRDLFPYYEVAQPWDKVQVRCWKRGSSRVDLVTTGGHEAIFPGRRIFPIRFICRHYPIRGEAHGSRKIFQERLPRFLAAERARGWHVQYEELAGAKTFIRDTASLNRYDPDAVRLQVMTHNRVWEECAAEPDTRRRIIDEVRHLEAALNQEIDRRNRELVRVMSELDGRNRELERIRCELDVRNRELEGLGVTLDELSHAMEDLHKKLDERNRQVAELNCQMTTLTNRGAQQLQAMGSDLRSYANELERMRAELRAVYASRSWTITWPLRAMYSLVAGVPPSRAGQRVRDLEAVRPASVVWGFDRGTPVDRYYIHAFLRAQSAAIRGDVLEVKDSGYTRLFGGDKVARAQVIDVDATNQNATLVADLAEANQLPEGEFDCFILTQTLHIIFELRRAISNAIRLLKPGGVLLCTIPAVSRVNYENGGLESGDYWRLTQAAVRRLFGEVLRPEDYEVTTYGNVRVCCAFLNGLAAEELTSDELEFNDPWFPLIHCIRAVKPSSASSAEKAR